jgi:hypothetical protein
MRDGSAIVSLHRARQFGDQPPCPWATPTMPSGSSTSRLAKYSHDTADGDADAMIAPATIKSCGALDCHHARPGLAEKAADFLVERNPQRRRDALPWRINRMESCNNPATPTVAAMICALARRLAEISPARS